MLVVDPALQPGSPAQLAGESWVGSGGFTRAEGALRLGIGAI